MMFPLLDAFRDAHARHNATGRPASLPTAGRELTQQRYYC
jgi:hypothetical protein